MLIWSAMIGSSGAEVVDYTMISVNMVLNETVPAHAFLSCLVAPAPDLLARPALCTVGYYCRGMSLTSAPACCLSQAPSALDQRSAPLRGGTIRASRYV